MADLFDPVAIGFARVAPVAADSLVDASRGELAAVSHEHFPSHQLAMTRDVFALLEQHIEGDDLARLWDHVLRMAHIRQVRLFLGGHTFQIALGDRKTPGWHLLQIRFHGGPNGEPCATVTLPDKD